MAVPSWRSGILGGIRPIVSIPRSVAVDPVASGISLPSVPRTGGIAGGLNLPQAAPAGAGRVGTMVTAPRPAGDVIVLPRNVSQGEYSAAVERSVNASVPQTVIRSQWAPYLVLALVAGGLLWLQGD